MLLVWCPLLTGYEPGLVRDNLRKVAPRPPLPVVQVHGEGVSPKGREFEPPSARTLYTCGSVAGRSRVRGSVRYITHDSCAISVVPPFNSKDECNNRRDMCMYCLPTAMQRMLICQCLTRTKLPDRCARHAHLVLLR